MFFRNASIRLQVYTVSQHRSSQCELIVCIFSEGERLLLIPIKKLEKTNLNTLTFSVSGIIWMLLFLRTQL
jgi:hypothetical protein